MVMPWLVSLSRTGVRLWTMAAGMSWEKTPSAIAVVPRTRASRTAAVTAGRTALRRTGFRRSRPSIRSLACGERARLDIALLYGVIIAQYLLQYGPGPLHPGLHRRQAQAQNFRDLLLAVALVVVQVHRRPVFFRKGQHGLQHRPAALVRNRLRRLQRQALPAAKKPEAVFAGVGGTGQQPGLALKPYEIKQSQRTVILFHTFIGSASVRLAL